MPERRATPRFRVEYRTGPFGIVRRHLDADMVSVEYDRLVVRHRAETADGKPSAVDEFVPLRRVVRVIVRALFYNPRGGDEDDEDDGGDEIEPPVGLASGARGREPREPEGPQPDDEDDDTANPWPGFDPSVR